MTVKLHQPVAGLDTGQEYTGPMEPWLVANGYAGTTDGVNKEHITGAAVEDDPTHAPNEIAEDADQAAAPVENGDREPAPLQPRVVPKLGADEADESREAAEARDGSVSVEDVKPAEREPLPDTSREKVGGEGDTSVVQTVAKAVKRRAKKGTDDNVAAEAQVDAPSVATAQAVEGTDTDE